MAKKFKIGQKVVCKNDNSLVHGTPQGIERGGVYTIIGITKCNNCGCELLELDEVPKLDTWCGVCDSKLPQKQVYHAIRFKKLKKKHIKKVRGVLFLID